MTKQKMTYSDKIWHNIAFLIGSAFVYTTLQNVLSIWLSVAITMIVVTIIGVWKEKYDKSHGGIFDWLDLLADELGGVEGIVIVIFLK